MAGADTQALSAIFKDVYEEGVSEGVNQKNPLRDLIKTEKSPMRGVEIQKAMHTGRNISPMFVGEDGAFADAGNQTHVRFNISQKKQMARIRLTWEAIQDSTSNEAAFVSARKSEMQFLIDDLARRVEHALASDGRGVLALVDEADPDGN